MEVIKWKAKNELEKAGLKIVRLLNKHGCQAFYVGGIVRDHLLGRSSDNLDVATDCLPDDVIRALDKARIRHKEFGKKFGTILAIVGAEKVEITTFRREGRYSDQRHPDQVEFIREYLDDARRRDLTINALYFEPVNQHLFDPVKGREDLDKKIIRFVGDPKKRIDEDPLRMLRAVRLATILDFKLEKNSFAAIKTRAKLIQSVAAQRIQMELAKIFRSENHSVGLKILKETGLEKFVIKK